MTEARPRESSDETTSWWRYAQSQMDRRGWNVADLGRAFDSPTLGYKWRDGQTPELAMIRRAADVFGSPLAEVLAATGWATLQELGQKVSTEWDPERLSNAELFEALDQVLSVLKERLGAARAADEDETLAAVEELKSRGARTATRPIAKKAAAKKPPTKSAVQKRGSGRD